jgi:hypothetical protein
MLANLPVIHTDSEGLSYIDLPPQRVYNELSDGEKVAGSVYFTSKGYAFLWPDLSVDRGSFNCTVWRENDKWFGRLAGYDSAHATGYASIPSDAVPIALVQ